jgi:CBS domain-containing protein
MDALPVRELMRSPVVTVSPRATLPQLKHLMREHQIRRLPVVENDRLVGIVTLGDVRNAFPSDATTLSIYELSYLLDKVTAAEVMRTDLITIEADTPVVEAARAMLEHKISGLPVVERGAIIGIITESDIFRAIVAGTLAPAAPAPLNAF